MKETTPEHHKMPISLKKLPMKPMPLMLSMKPLL
jgi:hypothetical protein